LKKTLVTLLLFALVLSSFSVLYLTQTVKAQTTQATILSYSWYVAPSDTILAEYSGDLIVVGEVQNTGTTDLGYIYIVASAYNSTGEVQASSEAKVFGLTLAAGAKAPFYLDLPPESSPTYDQSWVSNVTAVSVNVVSVLAPSTTAATDVRVPSDALSGTDNSGNYTVTGTVLNAGSNAVSDVVLYGTFYNSTGGVVAVGYMSLGASLQPAATAAFTMTPLDISAGMSSQIATFAVVAVGVPQSVTPTPTPPPTSAPTVVPTATVTPSPQPTQSTGSPQTNLIIYVAIIVVGIVIAVGLVLVLLKGNKSKNLPLPPPPA
jgi:hypothetical protein